MHGGDADLDQTTQGQYCGRDIAQHKNAIHRDTKTNYERTQNKQHSSQEQTQKYQHVSSVDHSCGSGMRLACRVSFRCSNGAERPRIRANAARNGVTNVSKVRCKFLYQVRRAQYMYLLVRMDWPPTPHCMFMPSFCLFRLLFSCFFFC